MDENERPTGWALLRSILRNIIESFLIAAILTVLFIVFVLSLVTHPERIPASVSAYVNLSDPRQLIAVYGILVVIASLYFLARRRHQFAVLFLSAYVALGMSTVATPGMIPAALQLSMPADMGSAFPMADQVAELATPPADRPLPPKKGEKLVTYDWKYGGQPYTLSLYLPDSTEKFYQALPTTVLSYGKSENDIEAAGNAMFIAGAKKDDTVAVLAKRLRELADAKQFSSDRLVELVAAFVQSIPYDQAKTDRRTSGLSTKAEDPTYPYEVLYDKTGVCQDKSYLAYAILKQLGVGVSIFYFPDPQDNHMAVGVKCPKDQANYGSNYCFLETTSVGNKIGMIPDLSSQSRIATAAAPITATDGSSSSDSSYHPLGNVVILNKADGTIYTGVSYTLATQKKLADLKNAIATSQDELKSLKPKIDREQSDLTRLGNTLSGYKDSGNYDQYNALVPKYNDALAKLKDDSKSFNAKVAASNRQVTDYNALIKSFYQ